MFSNKALAVFFVLCATVLARPIEPRSFDIGVEVLAARGPQDHTPPHQSHASSSSSSSHPQAHPQAHSQTHPIPIPHRSNTAPPTSHAFSTSPHHSEGSHHSDNGHHSDGSYHTAEGHSPTHSSHSSASGHSVYGTPPHPDQHAINAIKAAGHKINEPNTIHAWPLGRHVPGVPSSTTHAWLEEGNSKAGMQHVLKHQGEFAQHGVHPDEIPHYLAHATQHGNIVGLQGKGDGRSVYQTEHNGHPGHVGVTMGSNGFVVGANPTSGQSLKAAQKKWAAHTTQPHDYYKPGGNPGPSGSGSGTD